ncbi:hypothetical protein J7T55_000324 [Diaporthe amygdali]|uniref:uncharacterized protein n=1 Tax=Phomopsis amygdali TaxID=1214568 RepID=UPI0022FDDE8B|nr:uncharacterized protein J7T55_000324 [Diaporthe amygdali]KAJ0109399.1 hypothetical protein J7T55_000324 [Diaporthe amygdali]
MYSAIQGSASSSTRLDAEHLPVELGCLILEQLSSHRDLLSMIEAYPEWVMSLWQSYPQQLFPRALDNMFNELDGFCHHDALVAFHVRRIRREYAEWMRPRHETQDDRDELERMFRKILNLECDDHMLALEPSLTTILDFGDLVRDVNSLTDRYSNDAWARIHDIAQKTGTHSSSASPSNQPDIQLNAEERACFQLNFLDVEIYLLTKFWTNDEGERYIFNMGPDIEHIIPHSEADVREEFDSCLRYIFDAYRTYLKETARALGLPELPTRDDCAWVRDWHEDYEYDYPDYPVQATRDTSTIFAQRSISEEQRFLLWLCEFGIGPLVKAHGAESGERRDELLRHFGLQKIWDTVELRHRFYRYDACVDHPHPSPGREPIRNPRNRHPIMNLYGRDRHQRYARRSSSWACASAFLEWSHAPGKRFSTRDDIVLNERGRWITMSDTDKGATDWNPFKLKSILNNNSGVPHGHPYMFDEDKYQFRSLPSRIHLVLP